ncbi:hypothetical protein ACFLTH_17770 [Bacteroidota bacterium]
MKNENSENWSLDNFSNNKDVFKNLITNKIHPLTFSLLFIAGLIIGFKKLKKETLFGLIFIIPLLVIFTFYFGTWPRFFLSFYIFFTVFAAICLNYCSSFFKKNKNIDIIIILIILIAFFPFVKNIQENVPVAQTLETQTPSMLKKDLVKDCTIIASTPTVIRATTQFESISTDDFIKKSRIPSKSCVLLFEDMFCNANCDKIKQEYNGKEYLRYSNKNKHTTTIFKFYLLDYFSP